MSEELIVRHCSPTLAGMKTGNMFSCRFKDTHDMKEHMRKLNRSLVKKGIRVIPLTHSEERTLVYVFRPEQLKRDLENSEADRLLRERGYNCDNAQRCIIQLMGRLGGAKDFPHEIGLFLGYPPEDVSGFIENRAGGYKFSGFWKVYGDADKAKKKFEKFRRCTKVYCDRWAKGSPLEKLAVAA